MSVPDKISRFLKRIGILPLAPDPALSTPMQNSSADRGDTHGVYVCRAREYACLSSDRWRLLSALVLLSPRADVGGCGGGEEGRMNGRKEEEREEMLPPSNLPPASPLPSTSLPRVPLCKHERTRNSGIPHVKLPRLVITTWCTDFRQNHTLYYAIARDKAQATCSDLKCHVRNSPLD